MSTQIPPVTKHHNIATWWSWPRGSVICHHCQSPEACDFKNPFRNVTTCIPIEVPWNFGGTYCLHLHGLRYSKQATNKEQSLSYSYKTSVTIYGATRHHILENRDLNIHWLNNLTPLLLILYVGGDPTQCLTALTWRQRQHNLPKRQYESTIPHVVTSKDTAIFIANAMITSNLF